MDDDAHDGRKSAARAREYVREWKAKERYESERDRCSLERELERRIEARLVKATPWRRHETQCEKDEGQCEVERHHAAQERQGAHSTHTAHYDVAALRPNDPSSCWPLP